jgi:hypothetical protein
MSDPAPNTPPAQPPVAPPADPVTPPALAPGEQAVPYARFKEVNDKYTALKGQVTALTGEKEQQTQAQQTLEQRLAAIEAQYNTERAARQRLQVASAKKLPAELADRLVGSTEDELSADADRLLAFLKPAAGPGVPLTSGGGGAKPTLDLSQDDPRSGSASPSRGQDITPS